jgi:hypothetical protein
VDSHLNLLGRNVPVRITESSPWYLIGTVDGAAV